jgi:hypothetical protein
MFEIPEKQMYAWRVVSFAAHRVMQVGGRFRASKSAESRRGEIKKVIFPRTPGRGLE